MNDDATGSELARLLAATDLDELQAARDALTTISKDAARELARHAVEWPDPQGIANLLMYPEILPAAHRVATMLRALMLDASHYELVAVLVGLRRFDVPAEYRAAVGQRLAMLIAGQPDVVGELASVVFEAFVDDMGEDAARAVLGPLDALGDTARHNVAAALDRDEIPTLLPAIPARAEWAGASPRPMATGYPPT